MPGAPTRKILDGIRVLEWTAYVNGTAAGYMLGELGADVVKIEDPQRGDPYRGVNRIWGLPGGTPGGRHVGIELVNRNKRSLGVDLKHPDGRAIVHELAQKADVFFTNYFRNNVLERVGLDYDTLSALNPRLVYAVTTGWGSKSAEANDRAFGQAVEARMGAMWLTGDRDYDQPFMVHNATSDTMGATLLALGIMTALFDRERTGRGQRVETSLVGSQMHAMGHAMNISLFSGACYARHSRRTHSAPFNNFYRCSDGEWIFLTEPEADRFWNEFSSLFGLDPADPRFATLEARTRNAVELIKILDEVFAHADARRVGDAVPRSKSGVRLVVDPADRRGQDRSHADRQWVSALAGPSDARARAHAGIPDRVQRGPCRAAARRTGRWGRRRRCPRGVAGRVARTRRGAQDQRRAAVIRGSTRARCPGCCWSDWLRRS